MTPSLQRELGLLGIWMLLMFLLGVATDSIAGFMFTGLLLYLVWHLYNLNRLALWLGKPSRQIPEARGVWDEIYYQLFNLYKRQRKARRKLTSILTRFQASTEALPYATIVLNASNEIEWFNPAAQHMFNLIPGHDVGQRINNLIRLPVFIKYLSEKDFTDPLEFEINQKKVLLNITSYGSGQYLLSARDITSRSQLDDMRRDFISNASHELRTPITVMSGYIEMLREQQDESMALPLEKIQQQSDRMKNIIDELIELAKLETSAEPDESDTVEVSSLLQDVYDEAVDLDQAGHNIKLSVSDIDTGVTLQGRYDEIRMAISNLLTNAIRYTPAGGDIELFARSSDRLVSIGVSDTGIGINYEHIPRLTERFYRVDAGRSRAQGGTGLGLAIVKHVLDRHAASLHVQSKLGEGSVFRCDFPRQPVQ